ncbi:MAG: multidrug efflux SMR transporter [Gammaproteobacteria bacterium]|nr:multidrug efflux SMR transporter [Gammaproteobacteria bacterium]
MRAGEIAYIYLGIAVTAEVVATTALKATNEFTNLVPSVLVIAGYVIAFYCLTIVIRTIPVGVAYAIWSGLGMVMVTILGIAFYRQLPDVAAVLGIVLIVAGVVVIQLLSKTVNH